MDSENLSSSIFYSAHLRCERAKEHLTDLKSQIDKYFTAEQVYTVVTEDDGDGVHEIHKLRFNERFPFRWRILASEVIEHARASLDHAAFASHLAAGGDPDARYVAFPFGRTEADLENSMRGRSKDLRPEIQTILRGFKCYEGGNGALYTLNELCNLSKHALIALMAGVAQNVKIFGNPTTLEGVQFPKVLMWDSAKNEVPYARTKKGREFDHEGELTVFVGIQNKAITSTAGVVEVLEAMLTEAGRVISALEAECKRLGWVK